MADGNEKSSGPRFRTNEPLVQWQTAMHRFVAAVRRAYGPRIHSVVLYGSRARGDAVQDSDIDVMVVLDECPDFWAEHRHLGAMAYEASRGAATIVCAVPIGLAEFESRQSPLLLNVRREGIRIS
jgi:hypothetical protein